MGRPWYLLCNYVHDNPNYIKNGKRKEEKKEKKRKEEN